MKKSKLCITTSYDNGFSRIGAFSGASIELYAERWGFDTYVDSQAKIERPTPWHRVRLIPELFEAGYEYVLWLDADAIFVDLTRNILDEVEDGKLLYLVEHSHPNFKGSKVPNTGVMLIKNCPWTVSLFEKIWSMEEYVEHPWWENAALINLFGYRNLLGEGDFSPNGEILEKVKFLDETWNHLPMLSPHMNASIEHFAGTPNDVRVEKMPMCLLRALSSFGCQAVVNGSTKGEMKKRSRFKFPRFR